VDAENYGGRGGGIRKIIPEILKAARDTLSCFGTFIETQPDPETVFFVLGRVIIGADLHVVTY